jgi:hypothetical protein
MSYIDCCGIFVYNLRSLRKGLRIAHVIMHHTSFAVLVKVFVFTFVCFLPVSIISGEGHRKNVHGMVNMGTTSVSVEEQTLMRPRRPFREYTPASSTLPRRRYGARRVGPSR